MMRRSTLRYAYHHRPALRTCISRLRAGIVVTSEDVRCLDDEE